MNTYHITLPLSREQAALLRAGDRVYLTGTLYTARDAAHKRLTDLILYNSQHADAPRPLPFPLEGETVYYAGPAPAAPGHACGSCGPTTSGRMDPYTPLLLQKGLRVMIGKGKRSPAVKEVMVKHGAVYLGATGGAAALISHCITRCETVAWEDLGAEAIHRYDVVDFPTLVLVDAFGNDLYEIGPARFSENGTR